MLEDFTNVNDSVTIYRFHNGWMVEVSGKDSNDNWPTRKLACKDLAEVHDLLIEYAVIPLND